MRFHGLVLLGPRAAAVRAGPVGATEGTNRRQSAPPLSGQAHTGSVPARAGSAEAAGKAAWKRGRWEDTGASRTDQSGVRGPPARRRGDRGRGGVRSRARRRRQCDGTRRARPRGLHSRGHTWKRDQSTRGVERGRQSRSEEAARTPPPAPRCRRRPQRAGRAGTPKCPARTVANRRANRAGTPKRPARKDANRGPNRDGPRAAGPRTTADPPQTLTRGEDPLQNSRRGAKGPAGPFARIFGFEVLVVCPLF